MGVLLPPHRQLLKSNPFNHYKKEPRQVLPWRGFFVCLVYINLLNNQWESQICRLAFGMHKAQLL